MQRHDWSSANTKEPMLHLSLSPCTGSWLQLASSSRHWCLHIEQHRLSTHLLLLPYDNLHPLNKSEIYELATPHGAILDRHKITLQNIFIHRSWPVEWTSHPNPECWIPDNFPVTPTKTSLPSSLDFIFKKREKLCSLSLNPYLFG